MSQDQAYLPMTDSSVPRQSFLFTRLADGMKAKNLLGFYYATFVTICCYTFVSAAQPYVLKAIGIPEDEYGKYTGNLTFYNELMIIVCVSPWGVLSDKVGRKPIYAAGLSVMALGLLLYPFATNFGALVGFRLIFAVGAAAAASMITAVLSDVVYEPDKGRAAGISGVTSGLGAVFAALILLQIPSWVSPDVPEDEVDTKSFRTMYACTAVFVVVSAVALLFMIHGRTKAQSNNKRTAPHLLLAEGFKAAWVDKRLLLAYGAGFVARGDAVVLTTFLSLWIQDYVINVEDGTSSEAAAAAGQITGIAQTAAIVFSLFAGYLSTRMDNVKALLWMSLLALVGYGAMCSQTDPTSTTSLLLSCIVGMGEIGVIVASQSLVARRSPYNIRGSIGGAFGLCGSIGIIVCSQVGGYLYDRWEPAPFAVFAVFNFLLVVGSAVVLINEKRTGGAPLPLAEELEHPEEDDLKGDFKDDLAA